MVIDRPGISIFHEPAPDPTFPHGTRIDDLPFPIEVHNVKLPNMAAVHSFRILFCQIMSLVCNSPVKIIDGWLFFEQADKSFNPYTATINMLRHFNLDGRSAEAGEADIERATCLYDKGIPTSPRYTMNASNKSANCLYRRDNVARDGTFSSLK